MDTRHKTQDARRKTQDPRPKTGSALILAVVLTSLLAIIGVMFLLSSRVDWFATSSIADNKDLGSAVDIVIAKISEVLAFDVPGDPCFPQKYYDYPDINNAWLACLEPYQSGSDYFWRQVSNIYGSSALQDAKAQILPDYNNTFALYTEADADGDGVSDSIWVPIQVNGQGITSSKGKPIYAAVRVIDNGGMLNVNTGYVFDPCNSVGSSQMQINLLGLAGRDNTHMPPWQPIDTRQDRLLSYRCGSADANFYEQNVVWQYDLPAGLYTPFDISDELVLRNRYILNNDQMTTRIENLWTNAFKGGLVVPRTDANQFQIDPTYWFAKTNNSSSDVNQYDYRHIATTYNLDRVINPSGQKMVNINTAEPNAIRDAIRAGFIDANVSGDVNGLITQITANLIDYRDSDSNVTVVYDDANIPHFGFETPCVYISEIAESNVQTIPPPFPAYANSYAIELYKPYWEDPCNDWRLLIDSKVVPIVWSGSNRFYVIWWAVTGAPIDVNGPNSVNNNVAFRGGSLIALQRRIPDGNFITVDYVVVPEVNVFTGWLVGSNSRNVYSYQRDIDQPIRQLWGFGGLITHVGGFHNYSVLPLEVIQAHPANKPFTNVGEFGQLFYHSTYYYGGDPCLYGIHEPAIRIDLNEPAYQQVFKYLTVMDPNNPGYGGHPYDETRIKGRININTAPWFVIAQLPWVSYHTQPNYNLARAIVGYRDTYGPFKSIGELMRVTNSANDANSIGYYASQSSVPSVLMTPADGAGDAFEQRDAIFARISNLVTVRSDVFTAYILVRIPESVKRNPATGEIIEVYGGIQKRVIAILDRSGVTPAGGKVKILAVQQVPDAR